MATERKRQRESWTESETADEGLPEHTAGVGDKEPKPLGQEAPEIVDSASRIGAKRLRRPQLGSAITAFVGGMSICFGAIAMVAASASVEGTAAQATGIATSSVALLVGSLVFPVGFVILLIGKSELFTENFLLPVAGVLERRGTVGQLLALWVVTLAGNLLGALLFAFLISRGEVLGSAPQQELMALAEHKVEYDLDTAFVKALFAGWLITVLTWLLVAAEGMGARLVVIWAVASLIVLGQFNHVVISSAEIFMAMMLGAPITPGEWLTASFLPALVGNLVGGLVFETLLQYVQAQYHERK